MAVVFILGPSVWIDPRRTNPSPIDVRMSMCKRFGNDHEAFLMEDIVDSERDPDLTAKFVRIMATRAITDVLIYWPRSAKMPTTLDEIIHLRHVVDGPDSPTIWLLPEHGIITVIDTGLYVTPLGSPRSRYLDALNTLRVRNLPWRNTEELMEVVTNLADDLPH